MTGPAAMLVRETDVRWRLPRHGAMRVPGIVYASEALLPDTAEALRQVANVATLPGIVGASYAMPDVHWGYGFPIGRVAATDVDQGGWRHRVGSASTCRAGFGCWRRRWTRTRSGPGSPGSWTSSTRTWCGGWGGVAPGS